MHGENVVVFGTENVTALAQMSPAVRTTFDCNELQMSEMFMHIFRQKFVSEVFSDFQRSTCVYRA